MRIAVAVAAAALLVPFAALACEDHAPKAQAKVLPLNEAKELQKAGKVAFLDANNKDTRAKFGVIPGATLLTSFNEYDPTKELPKAKDAKLVFYCASTKCTASDKAAEKALEAGYTDVNILREGIAGWKEAGAPVDKKPRS